MDAKAFNTLVLLPKEVTTFVSSERTDCDLAKLVSDYAITMSTDGIQKAYQFPL